MNIYTAVVIGCEKNNEREILNTSFGVDISYEFLDEAEQNITLNKVKHRNKSNSFSEDINAWKKVWGNKTELLKDPDNLKNSFGQHFVATDMPSALENKNEYLLISDENFTKDNDSIVKIIINPDNNSNQYSIINNVSLSKGLEILNFTKTEIVLPNQISNVLDFQLEFEKQQKFQVNDFSLYFVLPEGYGLGEKEAAIFRNDSNSTKNNNLGIPFETLGNNIASYIKEWITDGIEYRSYFRIYNPEKLKKFNTVTDFYKLQIKTSLTSIINPLINQLLYGFIIALFFTYGLDQTRLMNYRELYLCYDKIPPDLNFIVTFGLLFIAFLFKISIGKKKENVYVYIVRILGILSALAWLTCFYWYGSRYFYSNDFLAKPSYFPPSLICKSHILNTYTFALNFIASLCLYFFYKNEITISFKKQLTQILKRD